MIKFSMRLGSNFSLQRPDGSSSGNGDDNCKVLGDFIPSVFTKEPEGNDLPEFDTRCEDRLNNVNIYLMKWSKICVKRPLKIDKTKI